MSVLTQALGDGAVLAKRSIIKVKRVPDLLVFSTLSPIMFVLLFAYVFGSAIPIQGVNYREFLMAGIFAQTVVFGSTLTGVLPRRGPAEGDHRQVPLAADVAERGAGRPDERGRRHQRDRPRRHVGHRPDRRLADPDVVLRGARGVPAAAVFAYAFSWIMAFVGLAVRAPEVVNNASFIVIFPLTFIANTFVPTNNFPPVLKAFADWNPISSVAYSARQLFGNLPVGAPEPTSWPAAAFGVLHAAVGGGHPGSVRAARGPAVQAGGHPLNGLAERIFSEISLPLGAV